MRRSLHGAWERGEHGLGGGTMPWRRVGSWTRLQGMANRICWGIGCGEREKSRAVPLAGPACPVPAEGILEWGEWCVTKPSSLPFSVFSLANRRTGTMPLTVVLPS